MVIHPVIRSISPHETFVLLDDSIHESSPIESSEPVYLAVILCQPLDTVEL